MAIPLPVQFSQQPGGGLIAGMRGANALRNDLLASKIKGVEAQYAPWTNYANALSKMAYSQFVGPQSIAAILTNPATRGMFTPEQYNQLAGAFLNQMQNSNISTASLPKPNAEIPGLFGKVKNILNNFIPNKDQNNNALLQNIPSTDNAVNASPVAGSLPQAPSINPSQPSTLPGGSPAYNRATQNLQPGVYGGANPQAITTAGEAGLKAQTEAEAKAISDQWQKRQDDINEQVSGAQEMERQLEKLQDARSRLSKYETGPVLGRLPGITSAAQDADIAISNLVAARLKAWQSSRITNMDIGFGKMLKPGRYMNEASFNNEVNYQTGMSERLQEYPAFAQRAQAQGLTPAQADAVWDRYANEKPFYDPKNKTILDNNLNEWEQYLTPQSLQETFSPSFKKKMDKYRTNMAAGNSKENKKILNHFSPKPTEADINFMAAKYNISKDEVRKRLKEKGIL